MFKEIPSILAILGARIGTIFYCLFVNWLEDFYFLE